MIEQNEKSLVKTIENIWYHYKWLILLGAFFLIFFTICSVQMASNKEPDVFMYHVSTEGLTLNSVEKLTDSLSAFAHDYNDDGTVNVDFKEEIYVPDVMSTGATQLSVTDSFNLELFAGECVIYIMDESFYEGNKEFMADLTDILGYLPESAYDSKSLLLAELPAYKTTPGLCDLPAESFICFRKNRVGLNEMDPDVYENNLDYFRKFVEFVSYVAE